MAINWARLTCAWTGPGGPGASHLDVRAETGPADAADLDAVGTAFRAYYNTLAGYLPNDWSLAVSSEVLIIEDTSGELQDTVTITTAGSSVAGTGTGAWAGAVGVVTRFSTGAIIGGRRVRGRTFFVPAVSSLAFDVDGTLNSTCVSDFTTARTTLHTALATADTVPIVYSPTHHVIHDVTGFLVADRSAVLRSRRD
jgi:hypothetical protein